MARPWRLARWRMILLALLSAMVMLLVVVLGWQGVRWLVKELFIENPTFALQTIEVQNNGFILPEQVRQWAAVKPGDNLLALDLARLKRNLEKVPFIREATVERVMLRALILRVAEREPCAQIVLTAPSPTEGSGRTMTVYLDAQGFVLPPWEGVRVSRPPVESWQALPALVGVNPAELRWAQPVVAPPIQAALRLIAAFDQSAMLEVEDLARIDLSVPGWLQVTTGRGVQVSLGWDDLAAQMRRWRLVYDYSLTCGKSIASLDLSVTNNLPVRWAAAESAPAVPPRAPQPSRNRRNHV